MGFVKVVTLIKRRPDFTQAAFSTYWRTIHKQLALQLVEAGYFQGYIQNHRLDIEMEDWESAADGAPELWISHLADLQRLQESREYQQGAAPDEANFMVLPFTSIVGREQALIDTQTPSADDEAIKVMLFVQRAATLTLCGFTDLWLQGDAPYLMPEAKPIRLTRHAALPDTSSAFDGVESSWWPSLEHFISAWAKRDTAPADMVGGSIKGLIAREEWVIRPGQALDAAHFT